MLISTFHAYGVEFLRRYAERAGLARDFRLLDPAHAYMLMEELLPYFPTGYYINPHNPYGYLADLLGDISRAKDYLHTPDEYDQAVARMANAMTDDGKPVYKAEDIDKARERAAIFRVYKEHKQKRNLVDFSDLVLLPVKLLESDHEVLQSERWRYRQVLVDEFQDMNYASGKLLQWLCSPTYGGGGNLWAVGDLNQSIYRFRGAFPQQAGAKAFVRDYGSPALPATILELSCNYRSLPTIVSLANHLRNSMSTDGATLPLQAKREVSSEKVEQQFTSTVNQEETNKEENPTAKLYYTVFPTTAGEMASIAASIEQHRQNGYAYSDHAILCQRHVQADKLAEALTIAGIPVSRLGPFFNRSEIQEVLALLTLMNEDVPLALLKLGHGRLAVATLLGLVAEYKLKLRASLKDERVLIELDEVSRQVVVELSLLLERLDGCRSMWLLVAQYLFDYSPTIAKLTQSDQDSFANRQKLRALGQLLRLVAGFDREEEAKLYQAEARKLDRPLTFEEQESLRQTSLRPSEQRQNLLRYVNALVQSDTRIELGEAEINGDNPTSAQAGRVQIITAHTSKGLEFPFVYLPGLHQPGNPPTDPTQPAPPNFHFIVEDSQREDRRCLFYVSVTRARDALYLSWAEQDEVAVEASVNEDEEVSSKGRKAVRLRQPGEGLQAALQHRENHLDSWSSLEVLDPTVNQPIIGEFSSNPALIALSENGKVPAGLDYSRLRRYEECPSRYYYQYVMQGQGSARTRSQDERSQFYQSLAAAQKHLYTNLIDAGALPDLDSLLAVYHSAWRAPAGTGKLKSADLNETVEAALAENTETSVTESAGENEAGETSESYYRLQGVKTLQALHQQHQNLPEVRPVAVEFDVPHTVRLKNNTIFFRVDRLETFADRSKRLIHSRLKALPKDESKLDNDSQKPYRLLSLYAMAYPPLAGATPHKIILEAVGPEGAMQLETPKAYKKAQTYQKWLSTNNGSPGLLDRLDKLADSIRAGNFEPKKGEHCRACPFYTLVCPVKPD
jgi:superfamily I DNA/RNA helicase